MQEKTVRELGESLRLLPILAALLALLAVAGCTPHYAEDQRLTRLAEAFKELTATHCVVTEAKTTLTTGAKPATSQLQVVSMGKGEDDWLRAYITGPRMEGQVYLNIPKDRFYCGERGFSRDHPGMRFTRLESADEVNLGGRRI